MIPMPTMATTIITTTVAMTTTRRKPKTNRSLPVPKEGSDHGYRDHRQS
jgi:hypothetical protein